MLKVLDMISFKYIIIVTFSITCQSGRCAKNMMIPEAILADASWLWKIYYNIGNDKQGIKIITKRYVIANINDISPNIN